MTKRGKNEKFIGFWCTPMEKEDLEIAKKKCGYNSMSLYLKDRLFQGKIIILKKSKTDYKLKEEINKCTMLIRSETSNINQVIKVLNSLHGKKRKNGDDVLNTELIDYRLTRLIAMQNKINQFQENLIQLVEKAIKIEEIKP